MLLFSLGLLALPLAAVTQGGDRGRPAPVILTEGQEEYPLGLHLELLADPTGQLTIEEVSSPAYDDQFIPSQAEVPNFGSISAAIWARFQVRDEAGPATAWRLAVAEARLGYVDLFIPAGDGTGWVHQQAGRARPFTVREVPYRYGVFKVPLPPGQTQTIYLRVQSAPLLLPLTLWSLEAFTQHTQTELLVFGLFYGLMLVMLGYNLFLFASLRDRSYLYLALFITSFGLNDALREGLAQQYLGPAWPNLYGISITATTNYMTALLFGTSFLQTNVRTPRLGKVMAAIILIAPIYEVLALLGWVPEAGGHTILALVTVLLLVAAGYMTGRQGYRPARYFLLAWLIFLGAAAFHNLTNAGLLPGTPFGQQSMRIGMALMVLLLSLALADRINLLKAATEQANLTLEEEIQERKSAQLALGQSEKKYRTVVEQATVGILVMQGGQRTYYNPAWLDMTGYSAEEYNSIPFLSLVYADDLETIEAAYQNLVMGQEFEALPNFRITDKSGDIKWLSAHSARIEWEGKPAGMVFIKDITERKQAEESLQERKDRYRLALETGQIALWQMNLVTGQWELDGAVEQITGYTAEELGTEVTWEEATHLEDLAWIGEAWQEMLEGRRERYAVVHRMLHKDGSVRWVEAQGTAIRDENGQVTRILGTTRDITATRQAEELVAERTAELVEANQYLQHEIGERRKAEAALLVVQGQLAQRVMERTAELEQANQQLSALLDTLEQRVADRTRELTTFLDLTMLVSENRALPDILALALDRILEASQCQAVCLHLLTEDQTCLDLSAQRGLSAAQQQQLGCLPLETELSGWLADPDAPALDLALPGGRLPSVLRLDGFRSYLGTQLQAREKVQGILSYYRTADRSFSLDEISLLAALAEQLGIVIENHRLRGRIEEVAVVAERQRLARDLHDSINQSLYSLNLFAHAGQEAAADGDTERLAASLARVEAISLDVLREMRLLLFQLQPAVLAEKGLAGALRQRLESVELRLGIEVDYLVEGLLELPDRVAAALYQAALEALNNALKHAHASQISVHLHLALPTLRLEIVDNGQGFDPAQTGGGMGLKNIRHRMEQMGGGLEVSSAPGSGTRMVLAVDVGALEENRKG